MDNPSVENIIEAKKGITELVDLILADDNTTKYLLKITSHDYSTYVHSVNVGLLGVSLAKKLFRTWLITFMNWVQVFFYMIWVKLM